MLQLLDVKSDARVLFGLLVSDPGLVRAGHLEELAAAGRLPATLAEVGASKADLPALAREASEQWTAKFNPRPVDAAGAREVYECAF